MVNTLIYGYGNPGREDDGLGIAFVDQMQKWTQKRKLEHIHFDRNYQLNIEDALEISKYDLVLFADATQGSQSDFLITGVQPSDHVNFTMHAVSPSYIAYLCREIFKTLPKTYLLHIRGYTWEMREELSIAARNNLDEALVFVQSSISSPDGLEKILAATAQASEIVL